MLSTNPKPLLLVIVNNHFDLTWRRCWEKPFHFQGKTFVSYTDLQYWYLLDNIALAQQHSDYKFEAESAQVARKFIERCPEKLPVLQQLAREGRFTVTGGGEAIIDANMVTGESLVRNYVDGLLWVEETFGQKTRLAVRNDAFGNSAQLPQILRGVEIPWVTGLSYSPAGGLYWKGLDGSVVMHRTLPTVAMGGNVIKYPPCPACHGSGAHGGVNCPTCRGRGISPEFISDLPNEVDEAALAQHGAGIVRNAPEEMLPNPALLDWVQKMNETYEVRFALEEEALPFMRPWLDVVDAPPEDCLHDSVELNPNNTGCLVTRIQTKQNVRRQEYALQAAETLAVMAALCGQPFPKDTLKRIRHRQYFTQFHDAITATHIDPAYTELQEHWQAIDHETAALQQAALAVLAPDQDETGCLSVINPTGHPVTGLCRAILHGVSGGVALADPNGQPVCIVETRPVSAGDLEVIFLAEALPAFSARVYRILPAAAQGTPLERSSDPVIENRRFRVQADAQGLVSVFDKTLGREILVNDGYRPGELILEHDEGSPWATLTDDQRRIRLSPHTTLQRIEKSPAVQRLVFSIDTPREIGLSGKCLRAQMTVSLVEGLERVDFHLHASWECFNQRLRVAMPVSRSGECRHWYEIPYGVLARKPYAPSFRWIGANGDWPAINFAGVEQPGLSVALFNQGTPSYRMETGPGASEVMLLSLLRSPSIPTYLHEPDYYSMTEYDGMRDSGDHDFDFAVSAYDWPMTASRVVLDADAYQVPLITVAGETRLPALPQLEPGIARISALKWAEDGLGLVLRLVEFRGQGGQATLRLPAACRAADRVNLLERQPEPLPIHDHEIRLNLRPWEIASVRIYV